MSRAPLRRTWWRCLCALPLLLLVSCSGSDPEATPRTPPSSAVHDTGSGRPEHASGPSEGCDRGRPAEPGTTDARIISGGVERSYQLIIPESYDGTTPLPVVFGLHSLTVDYRVVPALSGFGDMAVDYDFIGVSPSGLLGAGRVPYWNAAPATDNYDLVFIGELLDHLEATLCVDTAQVFSVGMSNGAQMSSLLACRLGDRIAAIAAIAGVEHNEPCDGPPVPVMAFHGLEDGIVPYEGGGLNSVTIAGQNYYEGDLPAGIATPTGVDESMQRWAEQNGCDPEAREERISAEVRKRTWQNCRAATVLYVIDNGGHSWPGKPQPAFEAQFGHTTIDVDATALLFQFFFDNQT